MVIQSLKGDCVELTRRLCSAMLLHTKLNWITEIVATRNNYCKTVVPGFYNNINKFDNGRLECFWFEHFVILSKFSSSFFVFIKRFWPLDFSDKTYFVQQFRKDQLLK